MHRTCNKGFITKGQLTVAHWDFTQERNHLHALNVDKLLHNKVNMQNHMLTHTGEKPYKCDILWSEYLHKEVAFKGTC